MQNKKESLHYYLTQRLQQDLHKVSKQEYCLYKVFEFALTACDLFVFCILWAQEKSQIENRHTVYVHNV